MSRSRQFFVAIMLHLAAGAAIANAPVPAAPADSMAALAPSGALPDDRELANLVAFTRLMGYVHYFHPSDAAAVTDWAAFAVGGMQAVEAAPDAQALADTLRRLFAPIAPTVRVFRTGYAAGSASAYVGEGEHLRIRAWRHVGLQAQGRGKQYASTRVALTPAEAETDPDIADPRQPWLADLGGGVSCAVPLSVYADDQGTLPRTAVPVAESDSGTYSPADRATRFAAIALLWNIIQHSYPYFDVTPAPWEASLYAGLRAAAADADGEEFSMTLRRLMANLHDGHGYVIYRPGEPRPVLPLRWGWMNGQLVVTQILREGASALAPGDAVLSIDGQSAQSALHVAEGLVSGATPQWIRFVALNELARCHNESSRQLMIERFDRPGFPEQISVPCEVLPRDLPAGAARIRPEEVLLEVRPGILYVDLDRISEAELQAAMPDLERAEGLVFDLRGYPHVDPEKFFGHLSRIPMRSAQWHLPVISRPDRSDMYFERQGEWDLQPRTPFLDARKAFITDGRAYSFAESCMGIVEHYGLGEIVGEATAGTNGNVNLISLPGGYFASWTGMKVLKHDGSQHHAVGILPTIPAQPTRAGVAAGRDELLEQAVRAVSR